MIAELVVIIIVLAAVAFQYLKGKLLNSFIMFACSIIAVVIAFNYFELAAGLLIKRDLMIEWAYPGSLILIFLVAFAIIYAVAERFISGEIYFKEIVDVIGRCLFGVLIGLAISGVIITAVAMMPIPSSWPYQRFASDGTLTDKFQTNKTLLSKADSFVAGLFSSVSAGSMSSQTSFAAVHPDFINELHLNRTFYIKDSQAESISGKIPLIAGSEAATIKKAWVPETKLSSSSKALPLPEDTKNKPVIVRLAINGKNINQGGALDTDGQVKFSIAQIKLLTKPKLRAFASYQKTSGQGERRFCHHTSDRGEAQGTIRETDGHR